MTAYTLDAAADLISRTPDDVRAWVQAGHLIAVRSPRDGREYVDDRQLVHAERIARRGLDDQPTRARPMPIPALAAWLTDQGWPTSVRTVRDWVEVRVIVRADGGGNGVRALYDPYAALTVAEARRTRITVASIG